MTPVWMRPRRCGACPLSWQARTTKAVSVERRQRAMLQTNCMDKTICKYGNFDEMKADEYRYWQSRPVHERVAAVSELTEEGYTLKGFEPDAFRLQRTLVHFERAPR
jgi:hypothetical protein